MILSGKFGAPALYSSSQIEVLDEKKISAGNGQRLSNVLNTANSVFIKSYGPAPQLQSISINGLGAEQTVVLLDGVKLNSFQNAMFDLSLFPKELIGAIVVQTNGASALYGSEAMGGVVNIITKNKWGGEVDDGLHSSATVSVGSMNTHRWSGSTGYRKENSSLSFFLNCETSNGDYPFHFNGEKVRRKNNAYTLSDFGLSYGHIFDSTKTLSFTSFYGLQDKQIPGIETGEIPPASSQIDKNWNSIISFENYFSGAFFVKLG
ncbi:MAG: TonB-dependent receptor, partial [Ignavibacteriales bacterium]|nr:TonB-dependent receptor [Ignavibacteriales bacterium]